MARPSEQTAATVALTGGAADKGAFFSDKDGFNIVTATITDDNASAIRKGVVVYSGSNPADRTLFKVLTPTGDSTSATVTTGVRGILQGETEQKDSFKGDGSTKVFPKVTSSTTATAGQSAVTQTVLTEVKANQPLADRDGGKALGTGDVLLTIAGADSTLVTAVITGGTVAVPTVTVRFLGAAKTDTGTVAVAQTITAGPFTGDFSITLAKLPGDSDFGGTVGVGVTAAADVFVTGDDPNTQTIASLTADAATGVVTGTITSGGAGTATLTIVYAEAAAKAGDKLEFTYTVPGQLTEIPRDSGFAVSKGAPNAVYDEADVQVTVGGASKKASTDYEVGTADFVTSGDFSTKQLVRLKDAPAKGADVVLNYKFSEFKGTVVDGELETPFGTVTATAGPSFGVQQTVGVKSATSVSGFANDPGAVELTEGNLVVKISFEYHFKDTLKKTLTRISTDTALAGERVRQVAATETSAKSGKFALKVAIFTTPDLETIIAEEADSKNDTVTGDNDGSVDVGELDNGGGLGTALKDRVNAASDALFGTGKLATTKASDLIALIVPASDGEKVKVEYSEATPAGTRTAEGTVDLKAPTITLISPPDKDFATTGVSLSVTVTDSGAGIKAGDTGVAATGTLASFDQSKKSETATTDGFTITVPVKTGETVPEGQHKWAVTVKDQVDNKPKGTGATTVATTNVRGTSGNPYQFTIDNKPPKITKVQSGGKLDAAGKIVVGKASRKTVTVFFDLGALGKGAPIDPDSVAPSDFTVDGVTPSDAILEATGDIILLVMTADLTTDKPTVLLTVGAIQDKSKNTPAAADVKVPSVLDRLNPVVDVSIAGEVSSNPVSKKDVKITVTSTEPGTARVFVSYVAASGDATLTEGTVKEIKPKSTGTSTWETTVTIKTISGTVPTAGLVNVRGEVTDAAGNIGKSGVADPDGTDATKAGTPTSKAKVFEFDNVLNDKKDPGFIVSPKTSGTATEPGTDVSGPFVTVNFDDEGTEYGVVKNVTGDKIKVDTHPDVDLTKATLEMPDGTKVDVLAQFDRSDKNSFVMGTAGLNDGTGLGLGKYKITVQAKDALGNNSKTAAVTPGKETTATSYSISFNVTARAKYKIRLAPGLNLVSLPGTPADTDINAVIPVADLAVDLVTTYDPNAPLGPWLVATRNADTGLFEGTLSTIDSAHAYWIRATSFIDLAADIPIQALTGQLPPTLSVESGWNLVPVVDLRRQKAGTEIRPESYFTGLKWSLAYTFDTVNSEWVRLPNRGTGAAAPDGVSTTLSDAVQTGRGYWVFLTEGGIIVP